MDVLTKDAQRALAMIYQIYKERRDNGMVKSQANYLAPTSEDSKHLAGDVDEDIRELEEAGMISHDITGGILLKNAGIIYMEDKES